MNSVYIHFFHGRPSPDTEVEDWGADGPTVGPLAYVHVTYLSDVKFGSPDGQIEGHFAQYEDLIYYDGMFYGDFSVSTDPHTPAEQLDPAKVILPMIVSTRCIMGDCQHVERRACINHPLVCSKCGSTNLTQYTKPEDQPNED